MRSLVRGIARYLLPILILNLTPNVFSQSNNASIDGAITDPKGAVVQGANVVLISKDTKQSSNFVSDANGLCAFRNVVPGTYQLKVTAQGFGEYVQDGILVRVGYPIRQNIELKLEATVQKVEVSADASALNYENAELRNSIDPQVIEQVPLLVSGSIRSAANFASLLPGVVRGSGDVTGAHVNGAQSQTGIVVLDGIALFNSSGTQGLTGAVLDFPQSPDLISEFQVLTSNYDAQYGSAGGVTVENVRSGTNNFHGTAYEFHRDSALNATQWGADGKAKDVENDFGGNFGGPLKLPFWKNRNHRTYFFVNFEGFRIRGGLNRETLSLPSVAEQQGDFRDWADSERQFDSDLRSSHHASKSCLRFRPTDRPNQSTLSARSVYGLRWNYSQRDLRDRPPPAKLARQTMVPISAHLDVIGPEEQLSGARHSTVSGDRRVHHYREDRRIHRGQRSHLGNVLL
jgi:hypothetical protein